MLAEWLDTISNQALLLPSLCREKHFLVSSTSPIQILWVWGNFPPNVLKSLVSHLSSISFKQHTVPASQQLEGGLRELLAHPSCAARYSTASVWPLSVAGKGESVSQGRVLLYPGWFSFQEAMQQQLLEVREQLHGPFQPHLGEESLATPAGYTSDCQVYVRKEPAWSQWMTYILENISIRVWTFITEIIFQSIRTRFSWMDQLQSRK